MPDDLAILAEVLKDVDPEKLPHGLEQYRRFGPTTVRAILAVRDLVFHTEALEDTTFRIGLTADAPKLEAEERAAGAIAFQVVFTSPDVKEARIVEADVRLNFLWHFPGRSLNKGDYRREDWEEGAVLSVYVVCFPPGMVEVLGKV